MQRGTNRANVGPEQQPQATPRHTLRTQTQEGPRKTEKELRNILQKTHLLITEPAQGTTKGREGDGGVREAAFNAVIKETKRRRGPTLHAAPTPRESIEGDEHNPTRIQEQPGEDREQGQHEVLTEPAGQAGTDQSHEGQQDLLPVHQGLAVRPAGYHLTVMISFLIHLYIWESM